MNNITEHHTAASIKAGDTIFVHLRSAQLALGRSDIGAIRATIEDLFHTISATLSVTGRGDVIFALTANYKVSEEQFHATLRNLREYYHLADILWVAGLGHLVQEGDKGDC